MVKKVDSLMALVQSEKDPLNRYELVWDIYNTGAETHPLYFLEVGKQMFRLAEKNKDQILESTAWSIYGQSYRLTGNYIKALECHYKAIAIAEKLDNKSVNSYAVNQMGHIYKDREEYAQALTIYRVAKGYADRGKTKRTASAPSMNLGVVHLALGNLDSALYYSRLSMKQQHDGNITRYDWYNYETMAGAYSKMHKRKEAEHYNSLALQSALAINNERSTVMCLIGLLPHYQEYKQVDSFLYYGKMAIAVVDKTIYEYLRAKPAKMLSDYYENVNADSAIKYLKLYRSANETMNSTLVSQQLQMKSFEEEQRRAEISRAQKSYVQKTWIGVLVAGLIVLAAFLVFLSRNNRQKQKTNQQLIAQKKEIEETLAQLKETQSQLVQSEKMASLGELTAGIAHEIQNPLNFVNNFSELNKELTDELLGEMEKQNYTDARQIARDIAENSAKINHHGKRADAIVKGMLQHSRSSSGKKEPTDINALCDEYLRLAYHGLRAKDKSFNANFEAKLDPSIGQINIQPQEMGRVILNLINNAFYAVAERKKQEPDGHQPKVTVSTQQTGAGINIVIADNGTGIPTKVLDKIFQPFFTTKPTGKGTGLGLSLSYDIVKAHGGELSAENADEGAIFRIKLPKS
jgi:two-component system NtrC family sensor kinase